MSTKEKILEMASDPHKGEELTKQMITASKQHAGEVVIQVNDKQQIKLVRIAEVSK